MPSPSQTDEPSCPACDTTAAPFYPSHFPGAPFVFRCSNCGLCFVHPLPDFGQLAGIYDEAYTGSRAAAESCRTLAPVYLRKIESFLPSSSGFRFLEIGGSYGFFSALVQSRTGAHVTLLEPGATATEAARSLPIEVVRGYTDSYSPTELFDVVFAAHVVEHVPDLGRFIESCRQFLRPCGTLVLLTPNARAWKLERFRSGWAWSAAGEHTHLLTPESARLVLERSGFEVLDLKTDVPYWRQYPFFLTRQLSFLLTRLIGRSQAHLPSPLPQVAKPASSDQQTRVTSLGWKHYLRRSGRVILWAEYVILSMADRLIGLKRADELLIAARRRE